KNTTTIKELKELNAKLTEEKHDLEKDILRQREHCSQLETQLQYLQFKMLNQGSYSFLPTNCCNNYFPISTPGNQIMPSRPIRLLHGLEIPYQTCKLCHCSMPESELKGHLIEFHRLTEDLIRRFGWSGSVSSNTTHQ